MSAALWRTKSREMQRANVSTFPGPEGPQTANARLPIIAHPSRRAFRLVIVTASLRPHDPPVGLGSGIKGLALFFFSQSSLSTNILHLIAHHTHPPSRIYRSWSWQWLSPGNCFSKNTDSYSAVDALAYERGRLEMRMTALISAALGPVESTHWGQQS